MTCFDVFNGDADGICSLIQLRNDQPRDARLVTGVKRDIQLLDQLDCQRGDQVTVLDISLDKNRAGLEKILASSAEVFYVDHHFAGHIPSSEHLKSLIDTSADVCTSILVNQHLSGKYIPWAVVGAFGDNLKNSAKEMANQAGLSDKQSQELENLGTYINYNGYGAAIDDLLYPPAELFRLISPYANPFDFIIDARDTFDRLETGFRQDISLAQAVSPQQENDHSAVYLLPDASWARRVSGVFSNELANAETARAHAVVTERVGGGYVVSVRAPLDNKTGADELCRRFPSGGGRKAAAGINDLPVDQLDKFIQQFSEFYAGL